AVDHFAGLRMSTGHDTSLTGVNAAQVCLANGKFHYFSRFAEQSVLPECWDIIYFDVGAKAAACLFTVQFWEPGIHLVKCRHTDERRTWGGWIVRKPCGCISLYGDRKPKEIAEPCFESTLFIQEMKRLRLVLLVGT